MGEHRVKGIAFASVYAEDFGRAYAFYADVLGLEKQFDMGTQACFFSLPDSTGLYLQGGNRPIDYGADTMRAAFVFAVDSASGTFDRLKAAGITLLHGAPVEMGPEQYWFQFKDPCGNVLEVLGGR